MGVAISSREELQAWLEGKPLSWSQLIAARTALRVMPFVCDYTAFKGNLVNWRLLLEVFRTSAILSGAGKASPSEIGDRATAHRATVRAAARVAYAVAETTDAAGTGDAAAFAIYAAATDVVTATEAVPAAVTAAAYAFADAKAVASRTAADVAIWQAVADDCGWLESGAFYTSVLCSPLWPNGPPQWLEPIWARARESLDGADNGFALWGTWYQRKLDGGRFEFAGFDDAAEREFFSRLFAQDDGWWNREPSLVNLDIANWVAELARPSPTDEDLRQNSRAITFGPSPDSRVGLRSDQDLSQLDLSPEAQARHREALEEAQRALELSRHGVTQADDLERPLLAYLEAMGTSLNGLNPGLLIARGEKLRRLISLRSDPESFAAPFGEEQQGALQDWMIAHNLLVGLDPYLSGIEKIARGPDALPIVIELEALKEIIQSATNAGIPTAEAAEALNDVADNVPRAAPPEDRRNIQATEALKNFVRGVAETIKKHPIKTAGGIGGTAYAAANWVQRNMEWLRDAFANENSILSILEWIASLPL